MVKRDILSLRELGKEAIEEILSMAKSEKIKIGDNSKRDNSLEHISMTTLFFENSTRTKLSFLLAGKYLGAYTDDLSVETSSVSKGESLIDTGKTLDSMGTNVIVVRHSMAGSSHLIAKNVNASIINCGDGTNEHPTQGLLDMFTMKEQFGELKDLQITIVGDIAHSRVARSNIFGLQKMGAKITLAGPATLVSPAMEELGVRVTHDVAQGIKGADVIMGLRVQQERQNTPKFPSLKEYAKFFGVNQKMIDKYAKPDVFIMHPGPTNRGIEMSPEVIDAPNSLIYNQVSNGVAVRMACLKYVTKG